MRNTLSKNIHGSDAETGIKTFDSGVERSAREDLLLAFKDVPIPDAQVLSNLGLFLDAKSLSRILLMDFLYKQIVPVEGVVLEFGTRWGQNAALFQTLRGIYEPFNRQRKVVAFDTFDGFPAVAEQDGESDMIYAGNLKVTEGYFEFLSGLMATHEALNPLEHIKKNTLVRGDATETFPKFLEENPQTVVALAYFDFDIYEPTKKCLELIKNRLTKGSLVAFDEVNDADSPGETVALMESFGLENIRLQRFPFASRVSYFVVE